MKEEQKKQQKEKQKEIKPNYRVGNKKEILELLYTIGVIPYRSLRLLTAPAYARMYQRAINQMEQDGVIKVEKRGTEKVIMLQSTELQRKKYEKYLPEKLLDYYNSFSKRSLWALTEKNISVQTKAIRDTDAQMFFYACGFMIGPRAKDLTREMIEETENSYYSSREIKSVCGYKPNKDVTSKKITSSRVNGMLLSSGGTFAVYNLGNQMIEWRRFNELKFATYMGQLLRERSTYELDAKIPKEAIVMASSDSIFRQICELNYEKNRNYHVTYMNIDYVYDSIYAVPEDANGKMLMDIMNTRSWRRRIKELMLKPEYIEDSMYTQIPCDGYDKENDVHILIFCIPDLVKLKTFVARANLEGNKKKYRIYCYTYQIPLLVSLAGSNVEILKTDIKKFHDKYFAEKEIDSG